jgi:hypothetical protein
MKTDLNSSPAWWKEPYLWLVVGLPLSAVLACVVTALYVLRGPDRVVVEDRLARAMAQEISRAEPASQPALVGRNHSATGGAKHVQP